MAPIHGDCVFVRGGNVDTEAADTEEDDVKTLRPETRGEARADSPAASEASSPAHTVISGSGLQNPET